MAPRTRKQVISQFRNEAILGAARKVFAARGFEGAAVEEIARNAGVAKGTVYLYYPSKRSLYGAALREGLLEMGRRIRERTAAARSLREKIRAFMETKVAYFEEHRDFFRIYYTELDKVVAHPLHCERRLRDLHLDQLRTLRSALAGQVRSAPTREAAAFAIFDLTRGVITRRLLGRSRRRTEADFEALLEIAWKGIGR